MSKKNMERALEHLKKAYELSAYDDLGERNDKTLRDLISGVSLIVQNYDNYKKILDKEKEIMADEEYMGSGLFKGYSSYKRKEIERS